MLNFIINILIPGIFILALAYVIVNFLFDLLLRGFVPFLPSRPWVVQQLMNEIDFPDKEINLIAFSTGRSGFFHALESKYPRAKPIGIEIKLFPYLVARVQSFIRKTRIKIKYQPIHRVDVGEADFIYIHLDPDEMRGIGKKLKFECRPGTIVVSAGYNIPYLNPRKVIDLPDRKGRSDWLSRNIRVFQRKSVKFKKEKKAYFYEI